MVKVKFISNMLNSRKVRQIFHCFVSSRSNSAVPDVRVNIIELMID